MLIYHLVDIIIGNLNYNRFILILYKLYYNLLYILLFFIFDFIPFIKKNIKKHTNLNFIQILLS